MLIALAEQVMKWETYPLDRQGYSEALRPKLIENVNRQMVLFPPLEPGTSTKERVWNPFESIADAWELEGMVPEDRRHIYLRSLCYITEAFMENRGPIALHERDWKLVRRSPRQICAAVWESCCNSEI